MPTVLITGANRGIGLEFVKSFAADGWRVHSCARNVERSKKLRAVDGDVVRHKLAIFTMSGFVAALAGIMYAAHLGAVRGSTATGFELDIITIVLLGGVSIFGGSGTMLGVFLSTVLVLNIRNGLGLLNVPGHTQTGVVGLLLILSVLLPNLYKRIQERRTRQRRAQASRRADDHAATSTG